jgi:hypothetical protein
MPSLQAFAALALPLQLLSVHVLAQTDFSTTSGISTWDQSDWSLTASQYIPGQYQARVSLANG